MRLCILLIFASVNGTAININEIIDELDLLILTGLWRLCLRSSKFQLYFWQKMLYVLSPSFALGEICHLSLLRIIYPFDEL